MCQHSNDDFQDEYEEDEYIPQEEFQSLVDHKWEYLAEGSVWDDEDDDLYEEELTAPAEPSDPPNWNYDTTYNGSLMPDYPYEDDDYEDEDLDTDEGAEYPY